MLDVCGIGERWSLGFSGGGRHTKRVVGEVCFVFFVLFFERARALREVVCREAGGWLASWLSRPLDNKHLVLSPRVFFFFL